MLVLLLPLGCARTDDPKLTDVSSALYTADVIAFMCSQWSCYGWRSEGSCLAALRASPNYGEHDGLCYDPDDLDDCWTWVDLQMPEDCPGLPHACQPAQLFGPCDSGELSDPR